MELRILGPLEIVDGGRRIPVGAPKQRALLAALILRANQPVPAGELAERIWGATPPSSARLTLQGYVLRLRRALASADDVAIVTEPSAYRLSIDPCRVDVCRWAMLIDAADRAAAERDDAGEAARLREALALWRGEPLADVESDSLRRDEVGRLEEMRAGALERRIEADLRLGLHRELIGELTALTAAQPLRETFRAQLMLALHRADRRADALDVYRDARRALVHELGVEPCPRLRRLERAVLVADPSLDLDPEEDEEDEASPCALPPDVPHFVGREEETERILSRPPSESGPAVVAIGGMAGVGKTALVVHAAHRLAGRYPDGRLYADLGGTAECPMEPGTALDRFLRLLGVRPGRIPAGADERAALLRDRLAGRRVLLVLDNAADEAQVRPLIPGTAGCGVLVTSRAPLIGLEYAHVLELGVLDADAAVDLLAGVVGRDRTYAEADDARTLVAQCGGLPLAVRIAAARLAGRPDWTLRRLTGRLADEHRRLDRLSAGDLEVRSSIAISHDALAPEHRRPFRLIGLLGLPEVNSWMVAALLDGSADDAEDIIDALVDARLLEASRPDPLGGYRYRCHDLVRIFAREQALAVESPPDRRSVVARVLERLLAFALRADEALPSRRVRLPEARGSGAASGDAPPDPLAWFEAERPTLAAAVRRAVSLDLAETAWRLASASLNFLDLRGYSDDWREAHELALGAAREHHDALGEATMQYGLGVLTYEGDRYEDAAARLARALTTYRSLPDPAPIPEARMLSALGDVHHIQGRLDKAFTCFRAALRISERHDDTIGRANGLLNLGLVRRDYGRIREAMADLDQALTMFRAAGDEHGQANVLKFMAATDYYSGADLYAARRHAIEAMRLFRRVGDVLGEHRALRLLAMVLAAGGRFSPARTLLGRCLTVFRERGDRFGEAATLWSLAGAACQVGDVGRQIEHLQEALVLFRRLDVPTWEARTRRQLGAARWAGLPRP